MNSATEEIPSTEMSSTAVEAAKPPLRLAWPHLVLGAIGFCISLFSFYQHRVVEAGGSACGLSTTFSCDKVLLSPYAKIFGIPLGLFGMAFFLVVIVTAVTTEPLTTPQRKIVLPRLLTATAGLCTSIALTFISITRIHALCPVCLATHATVLLNFGYAVWSYIKAGRNDRTVAHSHNSTP